MSDLLQDCCISFKKTYKIPIYQPFKFHIGLLENEEYFWLKKSYFYSLLDQEYKDIIDVPFCSIYCKDIFLYLKVIDFWKVTLPPKDFFDLILENKMLTFIVLENMYNSKLYDFLKSILQSTNLNKDFPIFSCKYELPDMLLYSQDKYLWTDEMLDIILDNKNFELFLIVFNSSFSISIDKVAKKGCFEFLKYINENSEVEFTEEILSCSAKSGNIDFLKYVHEIHNNLNWGILYDAFSSNSIECVEYLCENNCPWNECVVYFGNHDDPVDCLRYLYKKGCPMRFGLLKECAELGYLKCFTFLLDENYQEMEFHLNNLVNIKPKNNYFQYIKILFERGFTFSKITRYLARDNLDVLNYLGEKKVDFL